MRNLNADHSRETSDKVLSLDFHVQNLAIIFYYKIDDTNTNKDARLLRFPQECI